MKSIITLIDFDRVDSLKRLLAKLRYSLNDPIIGGLVVGQLGQRALVSFNVNSEHYLLFLEKLLYNNISIYPLNKETLAAVEIVREKISKTKTVIPPTPSWDELNIKKHVETDMVEKYCKEGNYKELLQILRHHINYDISIVELAKTLLVPTIQNAIDLAIEEGMKSKFHYSDCVNKLLAIATDENIKALTDTDLSVVAGYAAVEICAEFEIDRLIDICNLSKLKSRVIMRGLLKFSQLIFVDEAKHQDELETAVRKLNLRFVETINDIETPFMSEAEKNYYNKLINYIKERR